MTQMFRVKDRDSNSIDDLIFAIVRETLRAEQHGTTAGD
jgi:hypothetical protein